MYIYIYIYSCAYKCVYIYVLCNVYTKIYTRKYMYTHIHAWYRTLEPPRPLRSTMLQRVVWRCSALQHAAVCCSVDLAICRGKTNRMHNANNCCVAACWSILQYVTGGCNGLFYLCSTTLQRVVICCSVLQCVAVRCSVICRSRADGMHNAQEWCVAACCSMLQYVAVCCSVSKCVVVCVSLPHCSVLQCVAVHCIVLQCGAVCCSVLPCVAVQCGAVQCSVLNAVQCVAV